jgi:Na+/melibiose symporter-like transporter
MIFMVTVIYLPSFYALGGKLSLTVIGTAFFAARLWDAITDTLIGALSDRTSTRWGRRKPWIVIGTPFLLICTAFLFMPPKSGASGLYLAVSLFLFYLFWTMVQIPYLAWGAELRPGYTDRNRIAGTREGIGTIGVMLASGLPLVFIGEQKANLAGALQVVVLSVAILMPIAVGIATAFAGTGTLPPTQGHFSWREVREVFVRNPLFTRFTGAQLLHATGWNIFLASMVIIVEYHLKLSGRYLSLIMLMNVTATVCMPLALRVGRRVDKHHAIAVALCGFVVFFLLMSIMPAGHYGLTALLFCFLGVCWAPTLMNANSMIPDVVDTGLFKGLRIQAGLYIALYWLIIKLAMALGVGLGLPLLERAGFKISDPSSPSAERAIITVSLYLPILFTIPSIILFWTYPLTRRKHATLRHWLSRSAPL